jgi:hypothetical protein
MLLKGGFPWMKKQKLIDEIGEMALKYDMDYWG